MNIMSNNDKDNFEDNGPTYLLEPGVFDWSRHTIPALASLVRGVKALHNDRKKQRRGSEAQAPPWYTSFGYEIHEIIDDRSSIFGAIYKLSSPLSPPNAPRFVVAFRGTIKVSLRDLNDDLRIILNDLRETPRAQKAIEAVRGAVREFGRENVWIAGHSLGAARAMLAAREMAKQRTFMENTFLFNPPFPSLSTHLPSYFLRKVEIGVKAPLALTLEDRGAFGALAPWRPRLLLNRKDLICSGYLRYFEYRGGGMIESLVMQYTLTGLWSHVVLRNEWREPMHLIPSAYVTENVGICKTYHGISQWWDPNLQLETIEYTCQV